MSTTVVRVTAPSRLHFGLLSFGGGQRRQFGGLGAMIEQPGLRVSFREFCGTQAHGPLAERAADFARRYAQSVGRFGDPNCRIEIEAAPAEHVGLGTGTQLGLAVAAGLNALWGEPPRSAAELARLVGRGARSAIGTHGFAQGGLIFERGKLPHEDLSPLAERVALPEAWRFLLLRLPGHRGLWGFPEHEVFARLPPVPQESTDRLLAIATQQILPAAVAGDFEPLSESLFRYGHEAGKCFAGAGGHCGAYASPAVAAVVGQLRAMGVRGVGQSSWGPTVFALLPDHAAAEVILGRLRAEPATQHAEFTISQPNNHGARIDVES